MTFGETLRTTMELFLEGLKLPRGEDTVELQTVSSNLILNKSGDALDLEPSSIQVDQLASVQLSGGVHNASPETIHFKNFLLKSQLPNLEPLLTRETESQFAKPPSRGR